MVFSIFGEQEGAVFLEVALPDDGQSLFKRRTCPIVSDGFQGSRFRSCLQDPLDGFAVIGMVAGSMAKGRIDVV